MNFDNTGILAPTIRLFRLSDAAKIPEWGTAGSACFDLSAAFEPTTLVATFSQDNVKRKVPVTPELEYVLRPGERALIPTGWVFGIPYDYSIRIHPRSGIAWKNGVTLANAEAVIDEDYTDETFIMLQNNSTENFFVAGGERIAQAELVEKIKTRFQVTSEKITNTTTRIGGLGSTGV